VVIGTDATRPIVPTALRSTSCASSSPVSTWPAGLPSVANSKIKGKEAPAYARTRVLTAEATCARPILEAAR
jgi:hypothetical protein